MYLSKSLLYAVSLLSTASNVLSAPVDVARRGAEPLVDVAEDFAHRAVVPTYTDLYTRMAYGSLVDAAESLATRAQNTDLPHPESEYRKVQRSAKGYGLVKRSSVVDASEPPFLVARAPGQRITPAQSAMLRAIYDDNPHIGSEITREKRLRQLIKDTGLPRGKVLQWFQTKRSEDKKKLKKKEAAEGKNPASGSKPKPEKRPTLPSPVAPPHPPPSPAPLVSPGMTLAPLPDTGPLPLRSATRKKQSAPGAAVANKKSNPSVALAKKNKSSPGGSSRRSSRSPKPKPKPKPKRKVS